MFREHTMGELPPTVSIQTGARPSQQPMSTPVGQNLSNPVHETEPEIPPMNNTPTNNGFSNNGGFGGNGFSGGHNNINMNMGTAFDSGVNVPQNGGGQYHNNQSQNHNSGGNGNGQQQKYNIIDLFWLINPKMSIKGSQFEAGEPQMIVVSYNADFGNLRIAFFNMPNGSIVNGNTVFLSSLQQLIVGTLYPASLFKLLHEGEEVRPFTCVEQLYKDSGQQWTRERPVCYLEKRQDIPGQQEGAVILYIKNIKDNRMFKYEFTGWQKKAFLHAAEFVTSKGYELTMMKAR